MERQARDNSGVLFKNDKKESEKHPDYKGSMIVNGTDYWLSARIKEGKSGKFMGLALSPKDDQPPAKSTPRPSKSFDDESDIPF